MGLGTQMLKVDVAIIGAGSAGMAAYRAAKRHTESVLLIEGAEYGTTCARVGCMPSKLLIAAADAAHVVSKSALFGVIPENVQVDARAVMARVMAERDRFVGFVNETVQSWPAADRLVGTASFLDSNTVAVGDATVRAKSFVIATGSSPAVPAGWREQLGDRLVVNDDVFSWQDLPHSVAVIGAGVIALELGQALKRLGVTVSIFARSGRIGPLTDPELQALSFSLFSEELDIHRGVGLPEVAAVGAGVDVSYGDARGIARVETFDTILVAAGREPNMRSLNISSAGLVLNASGSVSFDPFTGQVGRSNIFIAGDATADRQLLHEASDLGKIAGDNAARYPRIKRRPRRAPLSIAFTDPQIALCGSSHAELTGRGESFVVGRVSFADQGRSRVFARNKGALHLYADPVTGLLLGAEMIGPEAEHIAHMLAWSIQRGDTVQQMLNFPFYHPVVQEGLRTALRDAGRQLKIAPMDVETCIECLG